MPDNVLKIATEFDVGPIVAGTQEAVSSFDRLALATIENDRAQQALRVKAQQARDMIGQESVTVVDLAEAQADAAATAEALAEAEEALAPASEAAAAGMSSLERNTAYASARIATMESGMGTAGFAVARLAAAIPGLGLLWEAALPILLITAFIPQIEKLMKASLDLADAEHAVGESFAKQDDEIMKLNESYTRITQGPLAAYEQELRDIPEQSLNVTAETKILTKALDDQSHVWDWLKAKVQDQILTLGLYGDVAGHIWLATGEAMEGNFKGAAAELKALKDEVGTAASVYAYSASDAEKAIQLINDKIEKNKDLKAAMSAITFEIKKATDAYNAEITAGQFVDAQRTAQALATLTEEKWFIEKEKQIVSDKLRNASADAAHELATETARQIQAEEKLQETIAKTAAIQAEAADAAAAENARALPELSLTDIDAKKKAITDALNAERTDNLVAADQTYEIKVTELGKELALYAKGTEEYKKILAERVQATADYDLQVAEINRTSDAAVANARRDLENKYRDVLDKQASDAERAAEEMAKIEIEQQQKAQEQINADLKRATSLRMAELKAAMSESGGGAFAEVFKDAFNDEQMKEYTRELGDLTRQLETATVTAAQLQSKLAGGGILTPEEIERLRQATQAIEQLKTQMNQIKIAQVQLGAEMLNSWQQIEQAIQKATQAGFAAFNQNFIKMMSTGESFSKVMIQTWNSMVASFVNSVLKMGEQWIATELLKLETTQASNAAQTTSTLATNAIQRLDDAKTAASRAMASVGFPLDLIVGPLVFAAALAFEEGGVVPGGRGLPVPAVVHGGERVLTPTQNATFERAITNNTTGGNRTNHNHIRISVENHGGGITADDVGAAVQRAIRRGQLTV